ncbi:MAG: hypothetical protein NC899_09125 [Candidatus Omnitrophica bacterium]|nr:hypothetical protein [Candidatus Omnitrophota bacterium]
MEIIIKINIENLKVKRELICDICNGNIYSEDYVDTEIYAIFWKEKKELYLEKYICPDCYAKYYKKTKSIPFEQAPEVYKKALERDFGRNWHGIITPCSSMEEWKLLQENPFLIEFWGNKF